jgi:hypothetical protein
MDDDPDDDISVRGYLRQLRWIAPVLLVGCLALRTGDGSAQR